MRQIPCPTRASFLRRRQTEGGPVRPPALRSGPIGRFPPGYAASAALAWARQALSRLASCVLQSGIELPYKAIKASIADSIQLLVHIERKHAQRRVNEVLAIQSYSPTDDSYHLETVFACNPAHNQQNSQQESKL